MGKKGSVGRDKERGEIERLGQERGMRERERLKKMKGVGLSLFSKFFLLGNTVM